MCYYYFHASEGHMMKLFALIALISACTAGIIPRSFNADDHPVTEQGISKFRAPSANVKKVKWVDWKRLSFMPSTPELLDEKHKAEVNELNPQRDELQKHVWKDDGKSEQSNKLPNSNEAKEISETIFQSIKVSDNPNEVPDINLRSSEISNLQIVEEASVFEVKAGLNVSSPSLGDITKDLSVTKLTDNATDSKQTKEIVENLNVEILHSNALESELTDKRNSETMLTEQGLNTRDVNSLESNSTQLTHQEDPFDDTNTFQNKPNTLSMNSLESEIGSVIHSEEAFATEKIARHNASQVFYVDSTEVESEFDGVEATETSITDAETSSVVKPVSDKSSNILDANSVESSEISKFPDSEGTSAIENIDRLNNESQVFYVDPDESLTRDLKLSASEHIDSTNDSSKLLDVESPKLIDIDENAVFENIVKTSDPSNILDADMAKLIEMLNSTGPEEMSIFELIRTGVTNVSDILNMFNFSHPIAFEVVTENISSVESLSVDETELMNGGSEIAMFQEVSTNGFEFLIDSDTAKNMLLTELLNTQSFTENEFENISYNIVEEEVPASGEEIVELDVEDDEEIVEPEVSKEIGNNSTVPAQEEFKPSTDLNISAPKEKVQIDENAVISDDVSTGGHISDAPTSSSPKECPQPGFCLVWFFAWDRCTDNSQCLETQMCCKRGCSKRCVDV